eukprot:GHVU01040704.1.p1 GENE.GHVU01040704.1~~GHVU01040704.1.p1  ORF type:complete len:301 (-),score=30.78 GHVU01040704.1:312-1214(-)
MKALLLLLSWGLPLMVAATPSAAGVAAERESYYRHFLGGSERLYRSPVYAAVLDERQAADVRDEGRDIHSATGATDCDGGGGLGGGNDGGAVAASYSHQLQVPATRCEGPPGTSRTRSIGGRDRRCGRGARGGLLLLIVAPRIKSAESSVVVGAAAGVSTRSRSLALIGASGSHLRSRLRRAGSRRRPGAAVVLPRLLAIRGGASGTRLLSMQIKTLSGQTVTVDSIGEDDTIRSVKERLHDKEGVPPDEQRLVFQGKQLEDDKTVAEAGLREGSVVHLVLRLRGGGGSFQRQPEETEDE